MTAFPAYCVSGIEEGGRGLVSHRWRSVSRKVGADEGGTTKTNDPGSIAVSLSKLAVEVDAGPWNGEGISVMLSCELGARVSLNNDDDDDGDDDDDRASAEGLKVDSTDGAKRIAENEDNIESSTCIEAEFEDGAKEEDWLGDVIEGTEVDAWIVVEVGDGSGSRGMGCERTTSPLSLHGTHALPLILFVASVDNGSDTLFVSWAAPSLSFCSWDRRIFGYV